MRSSGLPLSPQFVFLCATFSTISKGLPCLEQSHSNNEHSPSTTCAYQWFRLEIGRSLRPVVQSWRQANAAPGDVLLHLKRDTVAGSRGKASTMAGEKFAGINQPARDVPVGSVGLKRAVHDVCLAWTLDNPVPASATRAKQALLSGTRAVGI
jgi:hypothetical protein